MSAMGELVQEVQEIVEDCAFRSEEEIISRIEERFSNPIHKKIALEMAQYEFNTIVEDLRGFRP
jgi:hypothetical protein